MTEKDMNRNFGYAVHFANKLGLKVAVISRGKEKEQLAKKPWSSLLF